MTIWQRRVIIATLLLTGLLMAAYATHDMTPDQQWAAAQGFLGGGMCK